MASQNVTEKILQDAKNEAKEILDKYKKEVAKITGEFSAKLTAKKDLIKAEVENIKNTEIMRAVSQKRLELNKQIVEQKQNFTKNIINEALDKVPQHKDYLNFLKTLIKKSGEKEGELIINKKDWGKNGKDLENFMNSENLNFKIKTSNEIIGGLLVKKGKITYHGSLNLISELLGDELTIAISNILF
jgi:vacuolar-type H+-ATPase subunit E/Vma4